MLILLLAIRLGWFPTGGTQTDSAPFSFGDSLHHLILPVVVLSLFFGAAWSRYVRSSMLDVLRREYLCTATAKGVARRRVQLTHALRNGLIPLVTVVALKVGSIFGGAVVTETIFSWPGLGRLFYDSLAARDYPVLMAMLVLSAVTVIALNRRVGAAYWRAGLPYQASAPWETMYPDLLILLTVLSVNVLGDGLRDALDPLKKG